MSINPQYLQNQIDKLDVKAKAIQVERDDLVRQQQEAVAIQNVSHSQAVLKLMEIFGNACGAENGRDFIISVIEDKQLREWFPHLATF